MLMDFKEIDQIKQDLEKEKVEKEMELATNASDEDVVIEENKTNSQEIVVREQKQEIANNNDAFNQQACDNGLVSELSNNEVAIQMAKESYNQLKNQKKIGKQIENVVKKNTQVDIETADIKVQEKDKNNKVKKAEIKNELLKLKNDKIYLKKEQKHRLEMQRAKQIREKYEDLLLRTCRKKQKDENGKWIFVDDENGKPIINVPGKFKLFWLRLFDGIISTLNQTADIFGALNKNVLRGGFLILFLLLLFVPPFRQWLFALIGIKLG